MPLLEAEASAFDRAAKLYRLALELRPGDDALARRLRMGLADALANAGRGPGGGAGIPRRGRWGHGGGDFELRRRAAMQYLISGHIDEGLAELRTVLKAVGMAPPKSARRRPVPDPAKALDPLAGSPFPPPRPQPGLRGGPVASRRLLGGGQRSRDHRPDPGGELPGPGLLLALRAGEPYRIARALIYEASHLIDSSTLFSLWSLQFRGEVAELGRRWPVVLKEALERGDRHMVTNLSTFRCLTPPARRDPRGR